MEECSQRFSLIRVAWPNVGVEKWIEVSVDGEVHPHALGGPFHRLPCSCHVSQKLRLLFGFEREQLVNFWEGQQQAIASQELIFSEA